MKGIEALPKLVSLSKFLEWKLKAPPNNTMLLIAE